MTWNELAQVITERMPEEERSKDAIVYDVSINNPSGGKFMKIWNVMPYDATVDVNFCCDINTEDCF